MEFLQEKKDDKVILSLKGRFSPVTAGKVDEKIKAITGEGEKKLALNFRNLDYINSMGLRIILGAAKKLKKAGGELVIFGMKNHVKEVFDMTGFSKIIPGTVTEEEALEKLG